MQYCSLLASVTSHIHSWVLFLLWLHPFLLSGVISPLISSSILGTYRPGEFLFQYPIILPFHTVHGVLKARILKWFAIPFSSGPHCVRPLHHDLPILGGPTRHGLVSLSYKWTSPDGQHQKQIDYILCSQRWRSSIQSAKTKPRADCGSDHDPIMQNSDIN